MDMNNFGYQFRNVSIGIDKQNNSAIYEFLNQLEATGKIDSVAREIVLKSFAGERLPEISHAKVKRLLTKSMSSKDVLDLVRQSGHPQQIVLFKFEIMLVVEMASDRERELENLLARILRLFL